MATSSAVAVPDSKIRSKYVLFVALGLMFLFVLWHNERFIVFHVATLVLTEFGLAWPSIFANKRA